MVACNRVSQYVHKELLTGRVCHYIAHGAAGHLNPLPRYSLPPGHTVTIGDTLRHSAQPSEQSSGSSCPLSAMIVRVDRVSTQ